MKLDCQKKLFKQKTDIQCERTYSWYAKLFSK